MEIQIIQERYNANPAKAYTGIQLSDFINDKNIYPWLIVMSNKDIADKIRPCAG